MARAALDLSNADLASASGVGVNTLSRFENGQDVRLSSATAIQEALEARGAVFVQAGAIAPVIAVGIAQKTA